MDTEKCPFIGIDCEYIPLARKSDAQAKEIERLRKELKESNANHELYERRWYLRENEIELLRKALKKICHVTGSDMEAYDIAENALKEKE